MIAYTEKNYSDALTSFTQALPLYLSINESACINGSLFIRFMSNRTRALRGKPKRI